MIHRFARINRHCLGSHLLAELVDQKHDFKIGIPIVVGNPRCQIGVAAAPDICQLVVRYSRAWLESFPADGNDGQSKAALIPC